MFGIKTGEEEGAPLLRASVSAYCLSTSLRSLGYARRITSLCVRVCKTRGLHVSLAASVAAALTSQRRAVIGE